MREITADSSIAVIKQLINNYFGTEFDGAQALAVANDIRERVENELAPVLKKATGLNLFSTPTTD